jgi:hypothetical protein
MNFLLHDALRTARCYRRRGCSFQNCYISPLQCDGRAITLILHRIALHYPGSRRSRGEVLQRLKDTVDAADWVRHGAFIINWERPQNRLVM